jgi:hypothetical protein
LKSNRRPRAPAADDVRDARRRAIARPARALAFLRKWGLLQLHATKFPSLVGLLVGEIRGSWWAHPDNSRIFHTAGAISDHPDVLTTKLVDRKVTFVHRQWWPHVATIGLAREPWQMRRLGAAAGALLRRVDAAGEVLAQGPAVRELEMRLLVAAAEVHTESGAHAIRICTWQQFSKTKKVTGVRFTADARADLEDAVARMNEEFHARSSLPWK